MLQLSRGPQRAWPRALSVGAHASDVEVRTVDNEARSRGGVEFRADSYGMYIGGTNMDATSFTRPSLLRDQDVCVAGQPIDVTLAQFSHEELERLGLGGEPAEGSVRDFVRQRLRLFATQASEGSWGVIADCTY